MQISHDECAKRRLVERDEIRLAVRLLMQHGYRDDDIAPQLSRFYYVDIDTLNEELVAMLDQQLAMTVPLDLEFRNGRLNAFLSASPAVCCGLQIRFSVCTSKTCAMPGLIASGSTSPSVIAGSARQPHDDLLGGAA